MNRGLPKFFQSYYLPVKFNFDKRRAHLSSLIISGQISRADALEKMKENVYAPDEIGNDMELWLKKLDWSLEEFKAIIGSSSKPASRILKRTKILFSFGIKVKELS